MGIKKIRLTESQLTNLIKKIIKETEKETEMEEGFMDDLGKGKRPARRHMDDLEMDDENGMVDLESLDFGDEDMEELPMRRSKMSMEESKRRLNRKK
jgi:hypothetical protein